MALVLAVELLQRRAPPPAFFAKHALGGHLTDVGRGEIDTIVKAVLELGQFDPLGVDGRDHFIQLLLGRDDDPDGCDDLAGLEQVLADLAELLHGGPQVFDLVAAAGDVLAHFVDDEDQRLAGAATAGKLEGPLDDLADGDGGIPVPLGVRPRIGRRICRWVQGVQHGTGTGDLLSTLADHLSSPGCGASCRWR